MKTDIASGRSTSLWAATLALLVAAAPALAQPAAQDPTLNPDARLEEAIRKLDMDDIDGATMEYAQALRTARRDLPKLKLVEGLLLLKRKPPSVHEALQSFEEYNKSNEGRVDYRGHSAVGRIYKESRRYLLATAPLTTAKDLAPRGLVNGKNVKADITLDLALAYHGLKRARQALEMAKEAEQLAGNDPEIQLRLAEVALAGEEYDTALRAADTAISLFRARIKTSPLEKGNYRSLLNAHQFKIGVGIKQADAQPQNPAPILDVSRAIVHAGDAQRVLSLVDARETALQALRREQTDARVTAQIKLFLASVEMSLGAFGEADERIAEVLREDPDNAEAQELRRQISGRKD